jgi:hypothetical protein
VVFPALRVDWALWTDPPRAALPDVEREQFVFGWPSGYASRETVAFVRQELGREADGLLVVDHTHSRRTTWHALGLAFAKEPRVELRDLDLADPRALRLLAEWARARPTLVVVSPVGPAWPPPPPGGWSHLGGQVARFCKPNGALCDDVYRLYPTPPTWGSGPAWPRDRRGWRAGPSSAGRARAARRRGSSSPRGRPGGRTG